MFNFFNKRNKKREGTRNFEATSERPANPTAETVVAKATERATEVQKTDAVIERENGDKPETHGVTSGPTENPKNPESSNDDKQKNMDKGQDESMTKEMLDYFHTSSEYTMTQITYSRHSEYVPNAIPMLIILDECLRLMSTSGQLSKYHQNFNPYAVKLGFCYAWYFQIIRTKLNAGVFDGNEPSMISRFTKAFPFSKIPMPNVLYPYFRTIVATKFKDAKYDWIIPSFGTGNFTIPMTFTLNNDQRYVLAHHNGLEYSCPNIPAMMMILSSFGAETQGSLGGKMIDGVYHPFATTGAQAATTGFNLPDASFDFTDNAADIGEDTAYTLLRTCGASERFKFWTEDAQHARRHMADSAFFGRGKPAVYCTALPAQTNAPQAAYRTITDIETFLFLSKAYNVSFFGYILEQMNIFCKFWKADKTLEDVPMVGGSFTTIKTHLRFVNHVHNAGDRYLYENRRCGLAHPNEARLYPRLFDGLTANFTTSRGGITRFDELIAFTFGTNSIPPIATIQAGNAARNFRSGKYFEEDVEQSQRYRLGDPAITDHEGYKPMYDGWTSEVLTKHLISRPY